VTCDVPQVTVFDRNILGAVAVKFKREEDAEACVLVTRHRRRAVLQRNSPQVMNGRFFAGQQLLADFWDGITNFAVGLEGAAAKEEDEVTCCRFAARSPVCHAPPFL
jgi:hypothetical protein